MPTYVVTGPDGHEYEINAPEGASEQDVLAYAQTNYRQAKAAPITDLEPVPAVVDPTEGMSSWDRFMAGLGGSYVDAGRGIKQAATRAVGQPLNAVGGVLEAIGVKQGREMTGAGAFNRSSARQQKEIDEAARRDAPLKRTPAGMAGNVSGSLSQLLLPGYLARNSAAARSVFLPQTIRGNATQGAAIGALQPVTSDGSRVQNTLIGGAAGGAGAAIPRAVGAALRSGQRAVAPFTRRGAEQSAAQMIRSEASNPQALLQANPSMVPGVTRTLFDESLDPGVARLETKARGLPDGRQSWVELDSRNNAARVSAIGAFAGDEADVAAAAEARRRTTAPMYAAANQRGGVDTSRLMSQVDRAISANEGRPAVQQGLGTIRKLLESPKASDVATLGNVRKTLGDMLGGKYGGESGAALAGSRELIAIRNQLDRVLGKYAPEYGQAQATFQAMSRPINRMETGQALLSRASGSMVDPITGLPQLTPAKFGQQVKNIDGLAQSATGFRKARAANVLEPQDMATIGAVNDDLTRSAQRLRYGSGGNSHTASQGALGQRMATQMLSKVPFASMVTDVLGALQAAGERKVYAALSDVLQNPEQYRAIAARLSLQERRLLEQSMVRIGGTAGVLAPTFAE